MSFCALNHLIEWVVTIAAGTLDICSVFFIIACEASSEGWSSTSYSARSGNFLLRKLVLFVKIGIQWLR
jgi:hypothetical protein